MLHLMHDYARFNSFEVLCNFSVICDSNKEVKRFSFKMNKIEYTECHRIKNCR